MYRTRARKKKREHPMAREIFLLICKILQINRVKFCHKKISGNSKCAKTKICFRAGMVSVDPCAPREPPADGASAPTGPRFALRVAHFGTNPSPGVSVFLPQEPIGSPLRG